MKSKEYEHARLCGRVRVISQDLLDVGAALSDLKSYQASTKIFETCCDLFALERELLDLPGQSGAPPALEDPLNEREIPF